MLVNAFTSHPGLDNLTPEQHLRVSAANSLYEWTCSAVLILDSRSVDWSVENPAGSLMWITTPFRRLQRKLKRLFAFSFRTCMFQAPRKKDTALWCSFPQLRRHMERKCDNQHGHLNWGKIRSPTGNKFATALECACNPQMCASWALAVKDRALELGYVDVPHDMEATDNSFQDNQVNKAILGCLPRGRRAPPVLSDFLQPQAFCLQQFSALQQLSPGQRLPASLASFPPGSRLIRFVNDKGGKFLDNACNPTLVSESPDNVGQRHRFALVGLPRAHRDYVAAVCTLTHPLMMALRVEIGRAHV